MLTGTLQEAGLPWPAALQQQAEKIEQRFAERGIALPADARLRRVLAMSDFVADALLQTPAWLTTLTGPDAPAAGEQRHYARWLAQAGEAIQSEADLMRVLRRFRREMLVRIAWLQTLQAVSTAETLQQLSLLAETLIVYARDWLWNACCAQWGTPCDEDGAPQPLLILGMGKLGGGELNFSSDVDLIFVYPHDGQTRGGPRERENVQFFTRLGQRLIRVLDQPDADGFVCRVDMRLRPFGDSGPLVFSFAALEDYYQEQGRDWERYAMVKARVLGDDQTRWATMLRAVLRPFVWRRYLDFSVIQSLRSMKAMIAQEVRRRQLTDNIKLGAGGIREIEFIVQVFQLIRGGREPRLQQPSLLNVLPLLETLALLDGETVARLRDSYLFLRRLENLLQAIADKQTQTLPGEALDQIRLSWGMGFAEPSAFTAALQAHMQAVHTVFAALIGASDDTSVEPEQDSLWLALWQGALEENEADALPVALDAATRAAFYQRVTAFRHDLNKRTIGPRGRAVLDRLMPMLLSQIGARDDADVLLGRLTPLLLAIVSRTPYLELLAENPPARQHLITLCAASPMVASQLARFPLLLDELLNAATLWQPMASDNYRRELHRFLLRIPEEDEERQREALCQFKQIQQLRIAAADIAGNLPLMKVSDHLSWLAEAIIDAVVRQAWQAMRRRYGQPEHLQGTESGFAVIAYGKLGGLELGYRSDLDLVFLMNCPLEVMTDGARAIPGQQFYLRLAQRIVHLFATRTASGVLYEVDTRLRPSGHAGLLVSTLPAFAQYQQQEAWTWEHQALVRARAVSGDPALTARFAAIREQVLCQPREAASLAAAVREMREKMWQHQRTDRDPQQFNIKADSGGITDIEFIAQYLVLRFADRAPALARWSDNVRIFDTLAALALLPQQEAHRLTQAYITLRDELHRQALQAQPGVAPADRFAAERAWVNESWRKWLGSAP